MINLTDSAINHLKSVLSSSNDPDKNTLRLWIKEGGCAGMEYQMKIIESGEVKISIDSKYKTLLEGCSIDYTDDLSDSGLKISNPNAARSCGCGTSFEPAPKEK